MRMRSCFWLPYRSAPAGTRLLEENDPTFPTLFFFILPLKIVLVSEIIFYLILEIVYKIAPENRLRNRMLK